MNRQAQLPDRGRMTRHELEYFANTDFSRSFNLLILEDDSPCKREKHKKGKHKKNEKHNQEDFNEEYEDKENDAYANGNDKEIVKENHKEKKYVGKKEYDLDLNGNLDNVDALDNADTDCDTGDFDATYIPAAPPLLKRSSKFFNLSIDSNFEPDSPVKGKFKRPHKLVSQSPSPRSNSRFKSASPKKKSSRFHKSQLKLSPKKKSNLFRKSPLNLSPAGFKKLFLPYKTTYNPYNDELPLRNRKFAIYLDDTESRTTRHPKTDKEHNLSDTFHEKENLPRDNNKASFLFVRPLQTAFESAGLQKKNCVLYSAKKLPPDTPMKRNPLLFLNQDHDDTFHDTSIEVGRNASYTHSNASGLLLFKIPSSTRVQEPLVLDLDADFDDMVPETPTKSWSRTKNLNAIASTGKTDKEPCTPILLMPQESMSSSQVTINLPSSTHEATDQTITMSFHEGKDIAEKDRVDEHLAEKFGARNIKYIGCGQFSLVYECQFENEKFAIKRTKKPVIGSIEKKAILREIEAMRVLTSISDDEDVDDGKENLVFFIEAWSFNKHYYIMTEFCEGGTLYAFLEDNKNYKIDEFRVWKILIEILCGLKFIHLKNYLHLDLKPANIFITFEGYLKIGDFGLCTKLPILEKDFDIEGDRNYIAPELINDKIYTPFADVFSVGLIILEIATNIVLPGNGTPWRKLRSGDLSDAGKLSSDNISDFLNHNNFSSLTSYNSSLNSINMQPLSLHRLGSVDHNTSSNALQQPVHTKTESSSMSLTGRRSSTPRLIDSVRDLIPKGAPEFLIANSHNLDRLVSRMLKPNPFERPTAIQILEMSECVEIDNRRKAGATIFEGEFGPNDD